LKNSGRKSKTKAIEDSSSDSGSTTSSGGSSSSANSATKAYIEWQKKATGKSAKEIRSSIECNKCGKKGQITIPRALLKRLGIEENTPMLIDVTPDGAIVLRQAAVLPVEIYSDARIAEFEREGTVRDIEAAAASALLKARKP
jgi:AbrB family looped-hinge helix DNA binding protein